MVRQLNAFLLLICVLLSTLVSTSLYGQRLIEASLLKGAKKVEIPFELVNNFMVVTVSLGNYLPLKFIVDTGSRYTILTKKELVHPEAISYNRKFVVYGADRSHKINAYLIPNLEININFQADRVMSILVLEEDYLQIENVIGTEIHGILGIDIFQYHVLEIDYEKKILTIFDARFFEAPRKGWQHLPMNFSTNKPYLNVPITLDEGTRLEAQLLIDTGADLSLLLHPNTNDSIQLPENVIQGRIGSGLGGFLDGYLGRVKLLNIPGFEFRNVVTHFQNMPEINDTIPQFNREGIIGSRLLKRFKSIFDFPGHQLYLKPIRNYNRDFDYDRSGMSLIAQGETLNKIMVNEVLKGSPAYRVGIQRGDQVLKLNSILRGGMKLELVMGLLQKKAGKKIRIKVNRKNEKLKFVFFLEDLI